MIESQLGYQGSRRNTYAVLIDTGKGKSKFLRGIEDVGTYFLVWDETFGKDIQTYSNVRRVSRVKVSYYKIEGFTAGSNTLPKTSEAIVTSLAADPKNKPTAPRRWFMPTPLEAVDLESLSKKRRSGPRWS